MKTMTKTMTRAEFLTISGLGQHRLEVWLEQQWLLPQQADDGAEVFSDADAARARLISDLSDRIGANDAGIDIILHLLDQMHGMRRSFELLRSELAEHADDKRSK